MWDEKQEGNLYNHIKTISYIIILKPNQTWYQVQYLTVIMGTMIASIGLNKIRFV